MKPHKSTAKVI